MSLYSTEQKLLGALAKEWNRSYPVMSSDLYKILGITTTLHQRLNTMAQYRKSTSVAQYEVEALLHHILWLVREGLAVVESRIMPFTDQGQRGRMLQVMTAKLRASFYHVLSKYHNESAQNSATAGAKVTTTTHLTTTTPRLRTSTHLLKPSPPENTTSSSTSFLTNPWVSDASKGILPPLNRPFSWKLETLSGDIDKFIMAKQDHIPRTKILFQSASTLALRLAESSPLRLAIALEYCIFLTECAHDVATAGTTARQALKECYESGAHIDEDDFQDAGILVLELKKYADPQAGAQLPDLENASIP